MASRRCGQAWRRSLLLVPLTLAACATPPGLVPLRQGTPLVIEVLAKPPGQSKAEVQNQTTSKDASTGAGVGGVAGAMWGLSCGPYAVLCVPLGLVAGLAYGSLAGAAVGLTAQLPEAKVEQLRARLIQLRERHDLVAELRVQLHERARRHWTLGTDPAQALVTVELQEVLLTSQRDDLIGFIVAV